MKFKRILCSALAAALAVSSYSISAFADDEKQMSVTVRIEGINKNLYYDTVEVPYTGDNLTVQNALMYVDEKNDDITISGVESGWITAVNDDMQATFGGWDGWLYTVNGVSPTDTVNNYNLSEGDSVVLYYGDPYGVGMQYPEVDASKISEGILTFTSQDTKGWPCSSRDIYETLKACSNRDTCCRCTYLLLKPGNINTSPDE